MSKLKNQNSVVVRQLKEVPYTWKMDQLYSLSIVFSRKIQLVSTAAHCMPPTQIW